MENDRQLKLFLTAIRETAAKEREEIEADSKRKYSESIDKTKALLSSQAKSFYDSAVSDASREQNNRLVAAQDDSFHEINAKKDEIKSEIRDNVCRMLDEYTKTDAYKAKIDAMLSSARELSLTKYYVLCRKHDLEMVKAAAGSIKAEATDRIKLGGLLIVDEEMGIIIDHSYDNALRKYI